MSLHETTELVKKTGIGSAIGIAGIVFIVILIRVGIMVKNYYFPPKVDPPTQVYGLLPSLQFPQNVVDSNFTYTLQTTTGELPTDLPDRLSIFPVIHNAPNFLNLDKVKAKVNALDFTSPDGQTAVPEIQLTNPYYEWDELKGYNRKIIFNINSYDFKMTSDYLSSLKVISANYISNELSAIETAQEFLATAGLTPKDIDLKKTNSINNSASFVTFPQLFSVQSGIQGNTLVKTTSLSKAHVIRVDFYQKDVEYEMNTGEAAEFKPKINLKLPILYPNPPNSTMNLWVASGPSKAIVTQAFFTHQSVKLDDVTATYRIKTPSVAFSEVKDGSSYIAAYSGTDNNILIKNVFLAYYLGEDPQDYLMPVYVFEGNNGFFAYVSAVADNQIQK